MALVALPGVASAASAGESRSELRILETRIAALSQRAQQLADVSAIKRLQRIYGFYIDKGQWDQAADLFADNGSIELGIDGVYVGRDRIRAYLSALRGSHGGLVTGQLNIHMQLQPVVTLAPDGRTAKARWRDFAMEGEYRQWAQWGEGIQENEYVKEGGVWKIKRLHLYRTFLAPYKGGWAALKPSPADWRSEAARTFPADQPPTAVYTPYPDAFIPPFHYDAGTSE